VVITAPTPPDLKERSSHDQPSQQPPKEQGEHSEHSGTDHGGGRAQYLRFGLMILTSAVVMYVVMYLNTYSIDHVYWSWTRFFMTMMSAATMTVIMLFFMLGMYRNRRVNAAIVAGAVVLFAAGLVLVRSQATIGDVAWMRAMIPHHSIAILTSERAHIEDPRVRELVVRLIIG
jgi:heme/copper-type cytochrome/quinol oxidase subunit 4